MRAERAEQERAEREQTKTEALRWAELDAQWRVGEARWRYADALAKDGYIPEEKRELADWQMALILRNLKTPTA